MDGQWAGGVQIIHCEAGVVITKLVRLGYKVNWGSWSADVEADEYSELLCSFDHSVDLNRWVEDSVEFYLEFLRSYRGVTWLSGSAILLDKKCFHFRTIWSLSKVSELLNSRSTVPWRTTRGWYLNKNVLFVMQRREMKSDDRNLVTKETLIKHQISNCGLVSIQYMRFQTTGLLRVCWIQVLCENNQQVRSYLPPRIYGLSY